MSFQEIIRAAARDDEASEPDISFTAQMKMMVGALWESPVRNRLMLKCAILLSVILATAFGQVMLARWNEPFYDALARKDLPGLFVQLKIFAYIAGGLLLLNVTQTWFNEMTALSMREGLSRDLVGQWLKPKRALRLAASGIFGVNPDQRLHEDARHLSEVTTDLGIGLVQATILLVSFVGVLWELSSGFVFHVAGSSFSIPGYMVWAAVLYAGSASLLSTLVGRKLVKLNANRYSREAELRSSLMLANENVANITILRGEDTERRHIDGDISSVLAVIARLAFAHTKLKWVTSSYGWLTLIVPIIIASPVYFSGGITFGGLMVAVAAFNQVYAALRWYVDNFNVIADWKATLMRVAGFRQALLGMDVTDSEPGTITILPSADGAITLDTLCVSASKNALRITNGVRLDEARAVLTPGTHVLINGDPGANRKLLFGALARVWDWGSGTLSLPSPEDMLFVPQTLYLPQATLREVLAYPSDFAAYPDAAMEEALKRTGIGHLIGELGNRARWDRTLDKDGQVSVALAGALLRNPRWLVLDDILEGLEQHTQERLAALMHGMTETTVIYIGRSETYLRAVSPRVLHLEPIEVAKTP